jgi:Uma2 family endonuclease
MAQLGEQVCFPGAPEVCVEVLSPSNTEPEMQEKMALYFDPGAQEVWLCDQNGAMRFFGPGASPLGGSGLFPQFPKQVVLA